MPIAQPSADPSSEAALAGCYSGYICSTAFRIGMTRDQSRDKKKKDEPPASPVGCAVWPLSVAFMSDMW